MSTTAQSNAEFSLMRPRSRRASASFGNDAPGSSASATWMLAISCVGGCLLLWREPGLRCEAPPKSAIRLCSDVSRPDGTEAFMFGQVGKLEKQDRRSIYPALTTREQIGDRRSDHSAYH